MKEEELLLFKEELAKIKASRNGLLGLGILIAILGIITSLIYVEAEAYEVATGTGTTFTLLPEIIVIVSFAIAIICCIIAELKYGKDYRDKLKELKKSGKG